MKRLLLSLLAILLINVGSSPHLWSATKSEDLFQQALVKESGERNLEAAIDLYKQVAADPGTEKLMVFEARLRMGSCYERLGKNPEAEAVYEQIIKESTSPQSEFTQEAQANLRRLQAQDRQVLVDSTTLNPETMVVAGREFKESHFSLALGPSLLLSRDQPLQKLDVSVRYRFSPATRPYATYVQLGSITPLGSSNDLQPNLEFSYQTSLLVITELPHGPKRSTIPEIGAGLAYTASKSATESEKIWSPALNVGMRFYADRPFSLLMQGTYIANPFQTEIYTVPSSIWTISAKLQIKLGKSNIVVRRKS